MSKESFSEDDSRASSLFFLIALTALILVGALKVISNAEGGGENGVDQKTEYEIASEEVAKISEGHRLSVETYNSCIKTGAFRTNQFFFSCITHTKNAVEPYGYVEEFKDVMIRLDLVKRIKERSLEE